MLRFYPVVFLLLFVASAAIVFYPALRDFGLPIVNYDGRFFIVASDCLASARSPYAYSEFEQCWRERTDYLFRTGFVFPPIAIIPFLPTAFLGDVHAEFFIFAVQFAALSFGAALLATYLSPERSSMLAIASSCVFFVLTLKNTGNSSSVYLGQLGLVIGVAVLALGLGFSRGSLPILSLGFVLALFKPHLTLLAVLSSLVLSAYRKRIALVIFALIAVFGNVWIFVFDQAFFQNFIETFRIYEAREAGQMSSTVRVMGLASLMQQVTPLALASILFLATAAGFAVWRMDRSVVYSDRFMIIFSSATVAGGLMYPHKAYDLGLYMIVFATFAQMSLGSRVIVLPFLLVLWRPAIAEYVGVAGHVAVNASLVVLLFALVALLLRVYVPR